MEPRIKQLFSNLNGTERVANRLFEVKVFEIFEKY